MSLMLCFILAGCAASNAQNQVAQNDVAIGSQNRDSQSVSATPTQTQEVTKTQEVARIHKVPKQTPASTASPSNAKKTIPNSASKSKKGRLNGVKIGIDPGHQSKQNDRKEENGPGTAVMKKKVTSGTAGRFTKIPEHEVNLAVALLLRDLLAADGAEVLMTRETANVDISNRERALLLNEEGADFVLRIHCDGNDDASVHGASMLVPDGSITKKINEASYLWGETIYNRFIQVVDAKGRGISKRDDQTGFNWSTVPVCTIEMGFMTNKQEDNLLSTSAYQKLCAKGLYEGIVQYFDDNPKV